jgi:hypothetical protein
MPEQHLQEQGAPSGRRKHVERNNQNNQETQENHAHA